MERQAWIARLFTPPPKELASLARAQAAQGGSGSYEEAVAAGVPRRSRVRSRAPD